MTNTKTFFTALAMFLVALPAAAQMGLGAGASIELRAGEGAGVRAEGKSSTSLGVKGVASSSIHVNATATMRAKDGKGTSTATGTPPQERGQGDENRSDRAEERSISGREFFKGEGFGGIVITPRAFHVDGDMVRTWTKEDKDLIKARGASDTEIAVAEEAKNDENISDIDIESDEKTGHGTVVVKYQAKVKLFGFIPVVAPIIATTSDAEAVVSVDAPWYVRWFTSTGDEEKVTLSIASKIKVRHDASLNATGNIK
jgi:hypothetical protein